MRVEETNELYAEKARCAKEETQILALRLNEDQAALDSLKLAALKVLTLLPHFSLI